MSRSPNYILKVPHNVSQPGVNKELPAGSFVRPIDPIYLPAHILETTEYKWHVPAMDVFCYTSFGIIVIPRDKLREV